MSIHLVHTGAVVSAAFNQHLVPAIHETMSTSRLRGKKRWRERRRWRKWGERERKALVSREFRARYINDRSYFLAPYRFIVLLPPLSQILSLFDLPHHFPFTTFNPFISVPSSSPSLLFLCYSVFRGEKGWIVEFNESKEYD